jgi:hypothetical protein
MDQFLLWQCGVKTFSEGEKHGLFATSHFPDYNESFFFFWELGLGFE